jgi:hypothetical protein
MDKALLEYRVGLNATLKFRKKNELHHQKYIHIGIKCNFFEYICPSNRSN